MGWEGVEMDSVVIKSINYGEDFRLVLGEGQFKWEQGLVIRGKQRYIYAAGDTLWVAVVVIYEGSDTLRKKNRGPRARQGCSRGFREKSSVVMMGVAGQMQI